MKHATKRDYASSVICPCPRGSFLRSQDEVDR